MNVIILLLSLALSDWGSCSFNERESAGCITTISRRDEPQNILNTEDPSTYSEPGIRRLTIGLDIRERFRYFHNMSFGDMEPGMNDYDAYLNNRILAHMDLQITKNLRLFTQIGHAYTVGKDDVSSRDIDMFDLSQAFIEFKLISDRLLVRLGRQELSFGSGRILGTSDGPNVAQNFDGIRTSVNLGKISGDFLFVTPNNLNIGVFDNDISKTNLIYGTYWQIPLKNSHHIDFYLLGNEREDITLVEQSVSEKRYSAGTYFEKSSGRFYYDFEATWQFGSSGERKISAYSFASTTSYKWLDIPFEPLAQLRVVLFSSNKNSSDYQTLFRPIYARPPVNNMAPFGPANIVLICPEAGFSFTQKLDMRFRFFSVWRGSTADGVYSRSLDCMNWGCEPAGYSYGRSITNGIVVQPEYAVNRNLSISLSAGYFKAAKYLENTGKGKDVQALFLVLNYSL
jgi:hypothetical protein